MRSLKEIQSLYRLGVRLDENEERKRTRQKTKQEQGKTPYRFDIINDLLEEIRSPHQISGDWGKKPR